MRKTDLKDAPPRIKTCQDLGACLLAPDCACLATCQRPKRQRLAPGVIDRPYLRRSRARQFAVDFAVAMALIFAMILLVELAVWLHSAGWF